MDEITGRPLRDLLADRSRLLDQLQVLTNEVRRRGIARTDNLVGELGERLALDVLGGTLPPPSRSHIDLIDSDGRRVQVKTRALPVGDYRVYDFASLEFDIAICIRFDRATFEIEWAHELTNDEVAGLATRVGSKFRVTGAKARDNGAP
jgi:hypothetical protein